MADEHWHASCSSTPSLEQHTRHAASESSCVVSSGGSCDSGGGCDSGCNFVDASFGDRATDCLADSKCRPAKMAAAMASAGGSADAKVLLMGGVAPSW
eukprot:scaffold108903_cov69-Phaeocystis_antarctica.AAC.3